MKAFRLILLLFFGLPIIVQAQDWDENYAEIDYLQLIEMEETYADSIESDSSISNYYLRMDKYRFTAEYTAEKRKIDRHTMNSMKRVMNIFVGESLQINELLKHEYKFYIADTEVWMPVQLVLEKDLRKELKIGESLMLYCLFLNEHTSEGKLYNNCLISEFRKLE